MKKVLVAGLVGLALTSSALAWGDREQGALTGLIIGGLIASQRAERQERHEPRVVMQPPVVIQQAPVIVYPAPQYRRPPPTCLFHPVYDQYGRLLGYERSCH